MLVLSVLVPIAVIGLIVWIIVGMKQRGTEHFTLAAAAAFYAQLMIILTTTAALLGGVLLVNVGLSFINIAYSYSTGFFSGSSSNLCPAGVPLNVCNPTVPQPDFTPQRTQDLVLGLTLLVVGVAAAIGHRFLARALRGLPGGRPGWVVRGTGIAFIALYGFAGLFGLIAGVYALISYFVVPVASPGSPAFTTVSGGQPFGDAIGAAVVFIPAWVLAMIGLRRSLAGREVLPPPLGHPAPPSS